MPKVIGVGTAVPPFKVKQEEARRFASQLFGEAGFDVRRMLPVFQNTTILERYFCVEEAWFEHDRKFVEKNEAYIKSGVELAERAVLDVCRQAKVAPSEIGHIFFVSTTGVSTPSLDAHLFNRIKFRSSILRTPMWGLGCGGGIAGIVRASDWLKAYPGKIALVVALELCGLTFIRNDLSKSNFIATSLFGDGCGALLMSGDAGGKEKSSLLSIEATGSVTWEDSLDVMGWEIKDEGFKVVFSKNIPHIVLTSARPAILDFLRRNGLSLNDIHYFLSHPGGAKVIEAYQKALELEDWQVESMRSVLSGYGNMSSATIFFVLQHFLNWAGYRKGEWVLGSALGPGFFSEMLLARCC